jgi:hypothetical protein
MKMKIFAPKFQTWLKSCVEEYDALSGTVHLFLRDRLELGAALDIPLRMRRDLAKVLPGEGMAGVALERKLPIRPGDLDGEIDGEIYLQPGARDAVALPVTAPDGSVRAVVGLSFTEKISTETLENLQKAVASLPPF